MRRVNGYQGESTRHKNLKGVARVWLLRIGAKKIDEEVVFGRGGLRGKGRVIADVVGHCGKEIIVVECGGSKEGKLASLSKYVSEVYVLPYGQTIPFRWSTLDNLCHLCGNRI